MIIVKNMQCSSIGARKKYGICHNVFLVNGILNDDLYIKWDDVDFQTNQNVLTKCVMRNRQ